MNSLCLCRLSKFPFFSIFSSTSRRFLFEEISNSFFFSDTFTLWRLYDDRVEWEWMRRKAIESKTHKVRWFITSQQALTLNASSDQNLENDLMQKMSSGNFMTPHIYSTIFFSFINCCCCCCCVVECLRWNVCLLISDDSHFCNMTHNQMDFLFKWC
jgi:hypothetical protein